MPRLSGGIFLDSNSKRTTYKSWTASLADTISTEHIIFKNPPLEVGLWTFVCSMSDPNGDTPDISFELYFGIDEEGTYYDSTAIALSDIHANASFTNPGTFICRLDALSQWHFCNGFKIDITRDDSVDVVIDYADVIAI